MLFKNITYLTPKGEAVPNAYVGVRGNTIEYVSTQPPTQDFGAVYNGEHKLLLPGFINTHSHIPMTLLRGYGEGVSLHEWLHDKVFPFEAELTPHDVYWATQLGIAEMLASGTTSFTDMYSFCTDIAKAVAESGIKANISRGVVNFDDSSYMQSAGRRETIELYEQYHNAADGRVQVEFSVHAEYTSTELNVRDMAALAQEYGVGIHTHLSETDKEHEECKARRGGRTPAQFMADCGIFDVRAVVAHCVCVEDGDIQILAKHGVHVAHNPVSNMKLGSGIAPVRKMLDAGINVALGTDGASSNNNLDMLKEARIGLLAQSAISRSHTELTPPEMFAMATVHGAKLQGRTNTGEIKVGNSADLCVIDLDRPHLTPMYEPLYHVLCSASGADVVLTMVDGQVLYQNGVHHTVDVERAKAEVRKSSVRILAQLAAK